MKNQFSRTRALPPCLLGLVLAAPVVANDPGALTRHQSLAEFEGEARSRNLQLHFEDFEKSLARLLVQTEFGACIEPVSSRSNDACFEPGGLIEGFTIRSSHQRGILAPGLNVFDVDSFTVGAWPYRSAPGSLNFTRLEFDDPPTFVAADVYGFKLAPGFPTGDPVPVVVEAFGVDGQSLGSFSVTPSAYNTPAFAGFSSSVPIAVVEFGTRVEEAGEQIDNLYFGGGSGRPQPLSRRLNFGAVAAGQVSVLPLSITNGGSLPLSLDAPTLSEAMFSIEEEDCSSATLPAGASCTIWIGFQPEYRDEFSARLQLDGDYPEAPVRVRLRGIGIDGLGGGQ